MGFFHKMPYTDFHEMNLDWVIEWINKLKHAVNIHFNRDNTTIEAENVEDAIKEVNDKLDDEIASPRVVTFNGRSGNVTAASGDYEADQIDYDGTQSGLSAQDVQTAIDEIAALQSGVHSFNGRQGDVLPGNNDYDADMIGYSNTSSGLTATDAQGAIDEVAQIAGNALSATKVTSFNGRSGVVVPAAHDYDASEVDYDNTHSGISATDTQTALDAIYDLAIQGGGGGGGGSVMSVGLTAPTGFTVSGSPVTSTGSLNLGFDTGYSLPTTAKQTNWDDAYTDTNNASDANTPGTLVKRDASGAFSGTLIGTANRATQDQYGNNIASTYLKVSDTARVIISATQPADTTALWIDIS